MSAATLTVIGCAVLCTAIKIAGPVLLGGRSRSQALDRVVSLFAPTLLAALVATQSLAVGRHLTLGAATAGVAASGVLAWRTRSLIAAVATAALVTALLRAG